MTVFSKVCGWLTAAEADRQGLAVELGVSAAVDAAIDAERLVGAVLVGAEVAGEAGERHRVAELAPALDVEPDAVVAAASTARFGTTDGLALGRADDVGPATSASLTVTIRR